MTTVTVAFEADPELEAAHRRREYAPGRAGCTCGWYPAPTPGGAPDAERALLAHRREMSRRRVVIDHDVLVAWTDQFGVRQFYASGRYAGITSDTLELLVP